MEKKSERIPLTKGLLLFPQGTEQDENYLASTAESLQNLGHPVQWILCIRAQESQPWRMELNDLGKNVVLASVKDESQLLSLIPDVEYVFAFQPDTLSVALLSLLKARHVPLFFREGSLKLAYPEACKLHAFDASEWVQALFRMETTLAPVSDMAETLANASAPEPRLQPLVSAGRFSVFRYLLKYLP